MTAAPLMLSTAPRFDFSSPPRMDFGVKPRRPSDDENADNACRAFSGVMARTKADRLKPGETEAPTPGDVQMAADAAKRALGRKRRRLVAGVMYSVDRAGQVHACEFVPKQRSLPPSLIQSWAGIA